jgi:hypothetical protein
MVLFRRPVPRYRLRYQSSNLEMPAGDFVIGRSSACHLSVDDASVSRRHALIRVEATGVTVQDLGSRNGVQVNGKRIDGIKPLQHLDRLAIGNQEMLFIDADQGGQRQAPTSEMKRCESCGAMAVPEAERCEVCGNLLGGKGPMEGSTLDLNLGGTADDVAKSEQAFLLVAGIADKALAMGSTEKGEQILAPHLDMMLLRTHRGELYGDGAFARAVGFALRLAEDRNSRRWLHFVFILHTATKRLMDAATIERLHEVVRKARYSDSRPLKDYLAMLAGIEERLTAADRFLVKRLEALHRVIAA